MTNQPDWLPPLVVLEDSGGDWNKYLEIIYDYFKKDFIESRPLFRGTRLALKRHPVSEGKEATFWHMTSEGKDEASRTPDLRRCERIRWPRPIIEEADAKGLKVWVSIRNNENRINIWLEGEDYVVVLAQRKDYLLPWTAFLVTFNHTRRRLQKEFESYRRAQGQKC